MSCNQSKLCNNRQYSKSVRFWIFKCGNPKLINLLSLDTILIWHNRNITFGCNSYVVHTPEPIAAKVLCRQLKQ